MSDDLRWLSRYQLLREAWRDRDRLVIDPVLEDVLVAAVGEGARRRSPSAAALIEELLPSRTGGARVTMVVTDPGRLASLSAARPGVRFVPLDEGPSVAMDAVWRTALVELADYVSIPRSAGSTTRLRIDPRLATTVAVLAQRAQSVREASSAAPRCVVISAPVREEIDEQPSVDDFVELVASYFDDAAIYGLALPSVVSAFRFVEASEDDTGDADDVGVEYDNSLVDDEPGLFGFVALSDASVLSDGLTLLELPPSTSVDRPVERDVTSSSTPQVHAPDREVHALDQTAVTKSRLSEPPAPEQLRVRLDRALAETQAAKWQVERLEAELRRVLARPVDDAEAKRAVTLARQGRNDAHEDGSGRPLPRGRMAAGRLAALARRVERGDVSVSALQRELVGVRRLLSRARR